MLRYRVNQRNMKEGLRDISIIKTEMSPIPGKEGDTTNFVVCYCDNTEGIEENQKLMAIFDIDQYVFAEGQTQQYQMTEWVKVDAVDNVDCVFTIEIPRYIYLNISRMYISQKTVKENGDVDEGDEILHIQFDSPHYMSDGYEDTEDTTTDIEGEESGYKDRTLIIQHLDDTGFIIESEINLDDYDGKLVSSSALTLNFTKLKETDNEELRRLVKLLDDAVDYPTSTIIYNTTSYRGEISPSVITAKRETPYFTERSGVSISVEKPSCAIEIPFGNINIFGVGKDQEIRDIVDNQVNSAINPINDMEKDMYYPVYKDGDVFKPIYKIRFNLHFREHRGSKWLVDPSSYWNGTTISTDGKVELMNDSDDEENGYFSYPYDIRSCQSDLISYLNFTNNDIKYQKSKVKKSFIRLSFYDSTITTEQNLLSTSTVFVNAGELFTKQIRNMENSPYSSIIYGDDNKVSEVKMGLIGAKVDREPYGDLLKDAGNLDEIEDLRLSSQFVVQDTNNSTASSEGFYQYFWKDYYNGSEPRPLYMRVEFNHAGYGITTPFMMPFWDKDKWGGKKGIKSFQEILDDWNDYPIVRDEEGKITNTTDGPYGIRQYMKFMYLYFQYQYDEKTDKHVYYLDNEIYGDTIEYNKDDGSLTINLYEAKISNDRETIG